MADGLVLNKILPHSIENGLSLNTAIDILKIWNVAKMLLPENLLTGLMKDKNPTDKEAKEEWKQIDFKDNICFRFQTYMEIYSKLLSYYIENLFVQVRFQN